MSTELQMLFGLIRLIAENPPGFWEDFIDQKTLLMRFEEVLKLQIGESE